jgi:(p)ppGpp synthase/HD superfamily hydrolase
MNKVTQMTLRDVERIAREAHTDVDKIGVPYFNHVRAVADGLEPLGVELEMAGLLHDIIEDTPWTAQALKDAGVPVSVVDIVESVTNTPGQRYLEKIEAITRHPDGLLVKISDNAHNSRQDRLDKLPEDTRRRLIQKYEKTRRILWTAARPDDVRTIVNIVNPALLQTERHLLSRGEVT